MDSVNTVQLRAREKKLRRQQMLRQPGLILLIILIIAILFIFAVYPLLQIFIKTIWSDGHLELSVLTTTMGNASFWEAFRNSVVLGLVVSAICTVIGFIFAFSTTRTQMPGRKVFDLIATMPIISPPFVIALALILLCGRSGIITKTLLGIENANVYGFHGLVIAQTVSLFPLAYLNLKGVLESLNTSVEDAATSLGASRGKVFRTVTLPLCVPAILSSFLIVFIKSISDFGNPQLLGGNFSTLSSQAYLQINGMYNTRAGALIAISILLPSLLAFIIQKYWVSKKSFVSVTGKPTRGGGRIRSKKIIIPLFIICLILSIVIIVLYATVVWISFVKTWGVDMSLSLKNFKDAFSRGGVYFRDSLILSLIATPITAMLGLIIAYLQVRKSFFGKKFISFATILTFAVPGIVLGISYILSFNNPPLLLTGTAYILVAALVFRNLSIGIEAGTNSLQQVDNSIEEASANLGANSFTTFFRISLPLMKSALYISLVNSFVRSMTSISAVIFLVSAKWNLLTVMIMSNVENGALGTAAAYCVMLMVIVFIAFGVMQLIVGFVDRGAKRRELYRE